MTEERIYNVTAVSLQTREHNFGVILFPHAARRMFGSSNLRLLIGLALQIGLTTFTLHFRKAMRSASNWKWRKARFCPSVRASWPMA